MDCVDEARKARERWLGDLSRHADDFMRSRVFLVSLRYALRAAIQITPLWRIEFGAHTRRARQTWQTRRVFT